MASVNYIELGYEHKQIPITITSEQIREYNAGIRLCEIGETIDQLVGCAISFEIESRERKLNCEEMEYSNKTVELMRKVDDIVEKIGEEFPNASKIINEGLSKEIRQNSLNSCVRSLKTIVRRQAPIIS